MPDRCADDPAGPAPRAPGDVLIHLRRARDHADRHYAQALTLDELAGVAGLSKYYFLRLFKATYGLTPALYVSRRRVERAQDLLRATNLSVTEVCHAVGFTSLGSFSSRFRELVGEIAERVPVAVRRSGATDPGLLRVHVGAGRGPPGCSAIAEKRRTARRA